jgi:hypothetical protein
MLLVFVGLVLHSTRGMLLELRRSMLDRIENQAEQMPNVIVHPSEFRSVA